MSLIVISIFSNAYGAVTYSAFTEDGRILGDLSIIDKNVNFNIIFYSDKKNDFDLLVQTDDNIHKEKILNQKPDDFDAKILRIKALLKLGKDVEASLLLDRVEKTEPDNPIVFKNLFLPSYSCTAET